MSVPFELVLSEHLEPSRYQKVSHYMAVESSSMDQNRCWLYVRLLKIFHLLSATKNFSEIFKSLMKKFENVKIQETTLRFHFLISEDYFEICRKRF